MTQLEAGIRELDQVFDVLSQSYRRRILYLVRETDRRDVEELTLSDLVGDEDVEEHRTLEFVHIHLPKLDDTGYVTWDRESNTIRRGPRFEEVAPFIGLVQNHLESLPDV